MLLGMLASCVASSDRLTPRECATPCTSPARSPTGRCSTGSWPRQPTRACTAAALHPDAARTPVKNKTKQNARESARAALQVPPDGARRAAAPVSHSAGPRGRHEHADRLSSRWPGGRRRHATPAGRGAGPCRCTPPCPVASAATAFASGAGSSPRCLAMVSVNPIAAMRRCPRAVPLR